MKVLAVLTVCLLLAGLSSAKIVLPVGHLGQTWKVKGVFKVSNGTMPGFEDALAKVGSRGEITQVIVIDKKTWEIYSSQITIKGFCNVCTITDGQANCTKKLCDPTERMLLENVTTNVLSYGWKEFGQLMLKRLEVIKVHEPMMCADSYPNLGEGGCFQGWIELKKLSYR